MPHRAASGENGFGFGNDLIQRGKDLFFCAGPLVMAFQGQGKIQLRKRPAQSIEAGLMDAPWLVVQVITGDIAQENQDITLYLNYPAHSPVEVWEAPSEGYGLRDLEGFCNRIAEDVRAGKLAAVADCAYCNGGDAQLVQLLASKTDLTKLAAYAGWNTSSNTLGTVACQAVFRWLFGHSQNLELFTAQRLYEDVGYCGHVRRKVTALIEPMGFGYFDAGETNGDVAKLVRLHLQAYMQQLLPQVAENYTIDRCQMPWKRMFEVDLTLRHR
jgi:hypothetical protein